MKLKQNLLHILLLLCAFFAIQANGQSLPPEVCNGVDDDGDGLIDEQFPAGIKLHLPFTGNTNDASGNGHNGVVYNATLTADRFGNPNSAYNFSGSQSFITFPHLPFLINEYTYSVWFRLSSLPANLNWYCIMAIGGVAADQHILVANSAFHNQVGIGAGSYTVSGPHHCYQGTLPLINQWHHVVVVRDNTELKIYVNNNLMCSIPTGGYAEYLGTSLLGSIGARDGNSQFFKGDIDEVMIFDHALLPGQIQLLYQNTGSFTVPVLETCNGIDDDCDGQIDEGVQTNFYEDADNDGFGNPSATIQACSAPQGYVSDNTDCDDAKASVYPNAPEVCDELDNNCNGVIDEGVNTMYYQDQDEDGFGNPFSTVQACSLPVGYVTNSEDCDDTKVLYLDADNDGFGKSTKVACSGVENNIDCNDNLVLYKDNDTDGFGSNVKVACNGVTNSNDCDDNNAAVYPDAPEIPNNHIDDNCNSLIDEVAALICSIQASPNPVVSGQALNTIYKGYGPQSLSLTGSAIGGTAPYTFNWGSAGSGSSIVVSPTATTTYKLIVTDVNGFTQTCTITVHVMDVRCGNNNNHVLVCHQTTSSQVNLCINPNAVANHLGHGDYLGTCVNTSTTTINKPSPQDEAVNEQVGKMYPNPANQQVNLEIGHPWQIGKIKIQVTDRNGRLIKMEQCNISGRTITLNTSGLLNGLYFIAVSDERGQQHRYKMTVLH